MDDREVLLRAGRDARSLQQFLWFCAFIGCWFVFGTAVNALIVPVLISLAVVALFVWLAVRYRQIGVIREGSELVVRNAFHTRRVPLDEIVEVGVESRSTPHVYVRTADQRVDVRPLVNKLDDIREEARSLETAVKANGGNPTLVDYAAPEVIAGSKGSTQTAVHTAIAIVAGFFAHHIFAGQWRALVAFIVAVYALGFLFRPLTRSVAVSERELTIHNARETLHVSWGDVFSVDIAEQPRRVVQVTTNEGRVVELEATRGRKNVDEIADRIRSEAQSNRSSA